MKRQSHKELEKKLREAGKAVSENRIALLNQIAISADAIELEYNIETEFQTVLKELLGLTTPSHYTGSRPPQRSYEQKIHGIDLYAFSIQSSRFKCRVYFKFALTGQRFWLVSLHQDRPKRRKNEKT